MCQVALESIHQRCEDHYIRSAHHQSAVLECDNALFHSNNNNDDDDDDDDDNQFNISL